MADELKAKGNAAFSAGRFEEAIEFFSQAIEKTPTNHVLFSNRSACHASLGDYQDALEDAKQVTSIKPDWPKGYSRLGAAYLGLKQHAEAKKAYEEGLKQDPSNQQLKEGLEQASSAGGKGDGLFGPQFMAKLAMDPSTRGYLSQPDFMQMLQLLQKNPGMMSNFMQDQRFSHALSVGLGINLMSGDQFKAQGPGAAQPNGSGAGASSRPESRPGPQSASSAPQSTPQPQMQDDEEDLPDADSEPEDEPDDEKRKKQALAEKDKGNAAYKAKRFDEAIEHYDAAYDLYDQDISFITNRAAVQFEKGDYEACMADCDQAVERGRELRADYKLVGRALTRKGTSLVRLNRLEEAVNIYHKALTEHRNADTLKLLNETEKKLKQQQTEAYIDLDKAAEEREAGNKAFAGQQFPEAVKHYTEALARGPSSVNSDAHKLYSNRAACYTKLGAWNEGLKDAEECIRLAPTFAKGYSRKGHLQFFMKEHTKALATYELGLQQDPANAELKEGMARCMQAIDRLNRGEGSEEDLKARQARGMQDPEVQHILTDPVMRQVLDDLQKDPMGAQRHLKHPDIAAKIQKLVNAGVVQTR